MDLIFCLKAGVKMKCWVEGSVALGSDDAGIVVVVVVVEMLEVVRI